MTVTEGPSSALTTTPSGVGVRIFTRTGDVGGDQQQQAYVRFTVDFAMP
jgi:hypothetical protein